MFDGMPLREEVEKEEGSGGVGMGGEDVGNLGRGEGGDEGGEAGVGLPVGLGEDLVEVGDEG